MASIWNRALEGVKKWRWWILGATVGGGVLTVAVLTIFFPEKAKWTGIVGDEFKITIDERNSNVEGIKRFEVAVEEPGKALWDWLELILVPLSLAGLGFWIQYLERKRATDEANEEVLQTYFDRVSALLVDKNILALAQKVYLSYEEEQKIRQLKERKTDEEQKRLDKVFRVIQDSKASPEERELLDAAVDVIRSRTLSILRRFENDKERAKSVFQFLVEAEILSKTRLQIPNINLEGANLEGANLEGANLEGVNLKEADLRKANLRGANLGEANLEGAKLAGAYLKEAFLWQAHLEGANLSYANLEGADLSKAHLERANLWETHFEKAYLGEAYLKGAILWRAYLEGASFMYAHLEGAYLEEANLARANLWGAHLERANFKGANLEGANLRGANLHEAKLCRTKLPPGIDLDPNRDCAELGMDVSAEDSGDSVS